MNILIVVDSFFKKAHVTPFRARFFNGYLRNMGHKTFILTSKIEESDPNELFEPELADKTYFYNRPILYRLTEPFKALLSKILNIFGKDLKQDIIRQIFFIPDIHSWCIIPRAFLVLFICLSQKIDLVFISASPFSSCLKQRLGRL
jgi:hypothetical protein